jgi:uncharacterized membrane protein
MTPTDTRARVRHAGPPLGLVALTFTVLFLSGLFALTGKPAFPTPSASTDAIAAYFRARSTAVVICAALWFGAAIPLGIFTAAIVSQLRFLGARVAGTVIALFGGFATAITLITSSSVLWTMARPEVAQDPILLHAFYWLDFALGSSGFSVPFGLLLAGVSIPAGLMKLLPKWIVALGLAIAVCGELSWISLFTPKGLFLVPLTRFPGFVWLIAAGFALPKTIERASPATIDHGQPKYESSADASS